VLERAIELAIAAHQGQTYGKWPYIYHLTDVVGVLRRFGIDREVLHAAGWLHDAVEDTDLTIKQIAQDCGPEVADIVYRVTDDPGRNRKERKEKTYPKLAQSVDAITVKLADRIANVEASKMGNPGLLEMYRREHGRFVAEIFPVSGEGVTGRMWVELQRLLMKEECDYGQ
jgi:(p)ppGpp synthase/HD superfamily hydrolase